MLEKFKSEFTEIIKHYESVSRPLVVYSSLWPFLRVFKDEPEIVSKIIIESLIKCFPNLLMPTFTNGYINGVCDLDNIKSNTGFISEIFRTKYNVTRTLSGFFSFAIIGDLGENLVDLKPEHAWGDNSVYHWMEESDALAVMIGVHPTHCSYLHRLEWIVKDKISYRYSKVFNGAIIRKNVNIPMIERLFIRINDKIINDFTALLRPLQQAGMQTISLNGIPISFVSVKKIKEVCLPLLDSNPIVCLKESNYA